MEIDITVIIAALGALIGLAASVAKLYSKGKAVIAAAKGFLEAIKQLFVELKKANDDGKITQEEYDLLMKEANDTIKKGQKAIKKGEDVLADLNELKTKILQIVASRAVNGDVEDAIEKSAPESEKKPEKALKVKVPVVDLEEKKPEEDDEGDDEGEEPHALGDILDKGKEEEKDELDAMMDDIEKKVNIKK